MAASPVPNQPYGGIVFRPKGRDLVDHFLVPKALGGDVIPGLVAEGVDVFSATPDALLRNPHWKDHGEVWCYFYGARPAGGPVSAPGGCWFPMFPYRKDKAYIDENGNDVRQALALRCRFRYHVMSQGGGNWEPKHWLMKEFRLNKGAAAFHGAQPGPNANMNCVVHKVYTKDAVPPPPARSTDDKSSESFQEGGSSLQPRSIRPPSPPKVVATPVAPRPRRHAQVIATPMAPPPPPVCSSQNGAPTSRAQPDSPNANMEPVAPRIPANKVPSGATIMTHYLRPKAFYGHLVRAVTPNLVAEGVDVFAMSPDALPFPPSHRKQNGEVWGYFFAAKPTTSLRPAHGGCWVVQYGYGGEKKYRIKNGEVLVFRRRLKFHAALADSDGIVVAWQQTRWLMKEYRINKAAPSVRNEKKGPGANIDLVVLKVFTEPMVRPPPPPPPSPAWFSVNGGAGRSIASGPSATVATCLSP